MTTLNINKSQLIKKNIFLDSKVWSVASNNARQKNISVAQEIRDKLAQAYDQNIQDERSKYIQERAVQRRKLAGSVDIAPNSDPDGAINHNDIYTV